MSPADAACAAKTPRKDSGPNGTRAKVSRMGLAQTWRVHFCQPPQDGEIAGIAWGDLAAPLCCSQEPHHQRRSVRRPHHAVGRFRSQRMADTAKSPDASVGGPAPLPSGSIALEIFLETRNSPQMHRGLQRGPEFFEVRVLGQFFLCICQKRFGTGAPRELVVQFGERSQAKPRLRRRPNQPIAPTLATT